MLRFSNPAPVVQTLDSSIHRANPYPANSVIGFPNKYPVDSAIQRFNIRGQTNLNSLARWLENPLRIAYVNYGRGSNHFPSHVKWLTLQWRVLRRGPRGPGCHFIFGPKWSLQGQEISFSRPGRTGPPFNLRVWMSGPSLLRLESAIADWMDTFWFYLKITCCKYPRSLMNWF